MGLLDSLKQGALNLDTIKAWFRSEAAELSDSVSELEDQLDADLSERERRLEETPTEAMERLQGEISANDSSLDAIRDRLAEAGDGGPESEDPHA